MLELVPEFESSIAGIVGAFFVLLLVLETRFALRQAKRSKIDRFLVNGLLSCLAVAAGGFVVAPIALSAIGRSSEMSSGLLRLLPLPYTAELVLGFLMMDLSFYYWHRANHSFPLLWRFHNVHHLDPDLDVSTSFRFHFGEVLYSAVFRVLQASLIGVSFSTFLIYELFFQCATLFHHGNVRLPIRFERALNRIFVTPRMHGIHHSIVKDETNSNYSVVFSWWDRLHQTLKLNVRQADLVIGVPAYLEPNDNSFTSLLFLPFRAQRQYWPLSSATKVTQQAQDKKNFLLA